MWVGPMKRPSMIWSRCGLQRCGWKTCGSLSFCSACSGALFREWPVGYVHPGGNPGANLKSISHRCHPVLVAFVWELTKETIDLPRGCLQGGPQKSAGRLGTSSHRVSGYAHNKKRCEAARQPRPAEMSRQGAVNVRSITCRSSVGLHALALNQEQQPLGWSKTGARQSEGIDESGTAGEEEGAFSSPTPIRRVPHCE